jgi:hypothetical protein
LRKRLREGVPEEREGGLCRMIIGKIAPNEQ